MDNHQHPSADLSSLRTQTATLLTAAITAALAKEVRLGDALTQINEAVLHGIRQPGHIDLVRREATYRLARAAGLNPPGLLTPNLAEPLASRDHAWPRPIRRTTLLAVTAQLPTTPAPDASSAMPAYNTPAVSTAQLAASFHTAARHAAAYLRTPRARGLTQTLTTTAREAARDLPDGYDFLLERELTLRLALTLALPVTGALAPGLDTALTHATQASTRAELADLVLEATRSTAPRTAPAAQGRLMPRQRTGTCPCPCSTGGICGGCGHAGCGR